MPLRHQNLYRRQVYKTGTVFSIGPTTVRYLVLVLLAVFSLLYLVESAQGADGLIKYQNLNKSIVNENNELNSLQINASRILSQNQLNKVATDNGLVPVGDSVETVTVPAAK